MSDIINYLKSDINFPISIPALVWGHAEKHAGSYTAFCSYLQKFEGDCCERVYAYRRHKGKQLEITEVMRRFPGIEGQVCKNIYFTHLGGYNAIYEAKDIVSKNSSYYGYGYHHFYEEDFGKWMYETAVYNVFTRILNPDALFRIDKYKYCAYRGGENLLRYLAAYNEDHRVEYFGKLGIRYTKGLMNQIKKDKGFAKWLRNQNAYDVNMQGTQAAIYAYRHHMTIDAARNALYVYNTTCRKLVSAIPELKGTKIDRMKLDEYLEENEIGKWTYNDYLMAVKELGLNLEDTKVVYPHDFQRMHDLRTNEMASKRATRKAEEYAKLNEKFQEAAAKYKQFEVKGEKYTVIIPGAICELVDEGDRLHHCVGRMGYDKKMADGKSLIAFIRLSESVETPFVTVEYLPHMKKVSQIYGDYDSRPSQEVVDFVNAWAEQLKEVA